MTDLYSHSRDVMRLATAEYSEARSRLKDERNVERIDIDGSMFFNLRFSPTAGNQRWIAGSQSARRRRAKQYDFFVNQSVTS